MDTCCLLAWTVTWALLVEPKVLGCPVLGHPKLSGVLLQALVRGDLTPGNVHHGGPRRGTPRPTIWCSCVPALLALALQLLSLELRQSAFPNLPTLGGREVGPSAGETKQSRPTFDGGRLHQYPRNENQQNLGKNER